MTPISSATPHRETPGSSTRTAARADELAPAIVEVLFGGPGSEVQAVTPVSAPGLAACGGDSGALGRPVGSAAGPPVWQIEVPVPPWDAGAEPSASRGHRRPGCWADPMLEMLRRIAWADGGGFDIDPSRSHFLFWEWMERANCFLTSMLRTALDPMDDPRIVAQFETPVPRTGQWHIAAEIVGRHGCVPACMMSPAPSGSCVDRLHRTLEMYLRRGALDLRGLRAAGAPVEAARAARSRILQSVARLLAGGLGALPDRFDWQWRDRGGDLHRAAGLSPVDFLRRFVPFDREAYVSLVHDPRADAAQGTVFTCPDLCGVVGGARAVHEVQSIESLRSVALRSLRAGEAVWIGVPAGSLPDPVPPDQSADHGAPVTEYGVSALLLTKAERLSARQAGPTAAALVTAVDVTDEAPSRWHVQVHGGSAAVAWRHGRAPGDIRLPVPDAWFQEHVYQVVVRRVHLAAGPATSHESRPERTWCDPFGARIRN